MILKSYLLYVGCAIFFLFSIVPNGLLEKVPVGICVVSILGFILSLFYVIYETYFALVPKSKFVSSRLTVIYNVLIPLSTGALFLFFLILILVSDHSHDLFEVYLFIDIFVLIMFMISLIYSRLKTLKVGDKEMFIMFHTGVRVLKDYKVLEVKKFLIFFRKIRIKSEEEVIKLVILSPCSRELTFNP
ncbi:hypothetical protein DFO77_10211 [Marinilabilia salmonicolor]|uniref:Uncharacterized protein n=1 Tax=Marinilabilia salmonicolor TaxID=989 RepID=A0A368VC51_9BACT|nr:hypothetical protein DFO77_10211 [Marinilabilia salmonicolor]